MNWQPMEENDAKSWEEFANSGLIWFTNRILFVFGWAITRGCDEQGRLVRVFPAKVERTRFDDDTEARGKRKFLEAVAKGTK